LKAVWKKWLQFAEIFGNFQMSVLLILVYWVMIPVIAIPSKILSDPLNLRKSKGWNDHPESSHSIDELTKQF